MQVSVRNIDDLLQKLKDVLGLEFFELIEGQVPGPGTVHDAILALEKSHPLAWWVQQLNTDVERSLAAKSLYFHDESFWTLDLLADLLDCRNIPGFNRRLENLKDVSQFYSTKFEIHIAASYARQFEGVEFVDPNSQGKSNEMIIPFSKGDVFIECKSLQDQILQQKRVAYQIFLRMQGELEKFGVPIHMNFDMKCRLEFKDVVEIADSVCKFLRGCGSLPSRMSNRYMVLTISHAAYTTINLNAWMPPEQTNQIVRTIKRASTQLPKNNASIIHVEVPYRFGPQLLRIADNSYDRVRSLLYNHSRINAVVINGMTRNENVRDGGNPIHYHADVVPNSTCKMSFPKDFSLGVAILPPFEGGDSQTNQSLPDDAIDVAKLDDLDLSSNQGTILVTFTINEPLPKQIGNSLIHKISKDGQNQLRIWQTFGNFARASIVHPEYGRIHLDTDLNDLETNRLHKIAISWSRDGITLACNGKIRGEINF